MRNAAVRIESIEIRNFKNVGYGYLDFRDVSRTKHYGDARKPPSFRSQRGD